MPSAQFTRGWPALAALGAALLFGAVGAGAFGAGAMLPGMVWSTIAAAQAGYALWSLHATALPAAGIGVALFLSPLLLWAGLMLAGLGDQTAHLHGSAVQGPSTSAQLEPALPLLPLLLACMLSVGVAVSCALALRRNARATRRVTHREAVPEPLGIPFVLGLVVGALAISGVVSPGLAATDAGRLAVPHGEHSSGAPATLNEP